MTSKNRYLLITLSAILLLGCSTNTPYATSVPKQKILRSAQQEAAFRIDTLLNAAPTKMGWWGVKVLYPETGEVIYERNASKMFMPASNMKMYTTAAALCLLGPDHRYETEFHTNGDIVDGTLQGDLIIRGSGDPSWSWRFYDNNYDSVMVRFVDSLASKGIKEISGNIIGDDNIFDDDLLGYGWSWDDEPYYYAAQLSGLSYSENYIDYKLIPDTLNVGGPVIIEGFPKTSYLNLRNDLVTVSSDTSTDWDYGREWRSNNGWFEGDLHIEGGEQERAITIHNPTLFTVHVLKERLADAGIRVNGDPIDADDLADTVRYDSTQKLFSYYSHPMSDIIKKVNQPSQNFIAETLQRTMGALFGEEGSSREGRKVQIALYDSLGMDTRNLKIRDGSGLSRHDLVSPNTSTSLLQMMWDHPYRSTYIESFPLSGVSGTIKRRMPGMSAEYNVRAKTGYIGYVRSLSGYTWTRSGEPIIFSIMVNHYTIPTSIVNHIQDQIASILSDME
ncbi:MAG: D-alanyl-D-alanine carboxypeptidase/D-alanyl-D-alanine-endopeptidase [Candidatus Marinimicrobia bacterium]|nr:D-alanyl-D-alanine carboxypeptidase/D-alanyl-D-alanine-endopeptidase [Candidatus Neomarinimicrobiota bacterium]MCF7850528.1 D-alanyl-D-alanine carboxypeptidase/D-alanyl-D-alanine-endopeptidase [Candidatus Neomarinimicrobiota bacterium]MCF7905450.1 D-alanyl-D-alanine carboxypeptidase/D-alanyl-D-alanine-endopeptidase [Candidatus Neomarinimicrobiota bacterium]